jgi:hypothetical protein
MDTVAWDLQNAMKAKNNRRMELAALPYEKKFEILLVLQNMTAPLLRARGKQVFPWHIEP